MSFTHHLNDVASVSSIFRSPSVVKERTRDDLIDSIIHTRTKEHRVMPGFLTASRSDKYRDELKSGL